MDTSIIQKTISWINDTFVPRGLAPIEDLPEAVPGKAKFCVIAQVLKSNWQYVSVNGDVVDLNMGSDYGNKVGWDKIGSYDNNTSDYDRMFRRLREESLIDIPNEISEFIKDFDKGSYPNLIDMEATEKHWDGDDDYLRQLRAVMNGASQYDC